MKKISKDLRAFTIMELLIALALTAVIFAISLYAVGLFRQSLERRVKRFNVSSTEYLLKKAIKKDCLMAEEIFEKNDSLIFMKGGEIALSYVFMQGAVLRKRQLATDTFKIVSSVKDIQKIADSVDLVSGFTLVLDTLQSKNEMYFIKPYSDQQIIHYLQTVTTHE